MRRREREWLDLVADLLVTPLTGWPDEPVVRLLVDTFDTPAGSFYSRSGDGPILMRQWPPEHFAEFRDEIARFTVRDAPTQHPLLRYYVATGDVRCMQVDEVPARFADEGVRGHWRELARTWGQVPAQIAFPLLAGPRGNRSFLVGRADPYTAQEMHLARRVHRLLRGVDRQITAYRAWSDGSGPAAAGAAESVAVTARELAVLGLLAEGLTALAIGHRLGIAERTVQKHLQHCYAKLGVSDRLDAVLRARRIGLLGTQFPS